MAAAYGCGTGVGSKQECGGMLAHKAEIRDEGVGPKRQSGRNPFRCSSH
jgi:hypothetical protein